MPCSPPPPAAVRGLKDLAMLELRKDIFADERDDNLKEIGKGTQRQDMLGSCHGHLDLFRRPQAAGHAASQGVCAARTPMPACAASTRRKRNARPACGASSAAPTCRSISTRCSA
jgi:hypothetical protein